MTRRPGFIGNARYTFDGRVIDLGRRIRLYRRLWNDMTQSELAEKAKLSVGYISSIELNRTNPSDKALAKIAGVFGVTVDELIGK